MGFIKDVVKNMKIRQKIITIYLIGGLVPQIILAITLTNGTKKIVIEQTKASEISDVNSMSNRMVEIMRMISDVSLRMYFDDDLEKISKASYTDAFEIFTDYSNYKTAKNYLDYYNREILAIRIYLENETIPTNSKLVRVTDDIRDESWYQDAVKKNGLAVWNLIYDDITKKDYLCLSRLIRTKTKDNVAVVSIAVKEEVLDAIIKVRNNETIILINDDKLIATNDSKTEESEITKLLKKYRENESDTVVYKGNDYLMTVNDVEYYKTDSWATIISLQPYKKIMKAANDKAMEGIIFIVISLIMSTCLIVFFSYKFSSRVNLFHKQMHKAARGDFNILVNLEGEDEIGELYTDLCSMIDSIENLIATVYDETLQKEKLNSKQKDVEFKMLASQINPHFLYNTLETIRMKARCNKEFEIEELVKMLAKIMRRNIEVGDKLVTLQSEIDLVEYYLKIQKYRFGEKITYRIEILCDINKYKVMPLIIQPIVENAFVHGLESKEGSGEISIMIEEKDNLLIHVQDDGVGIDEERLNKIRNNLMNHEELDRTSIGLSNVNQRIKLLYGEQYGIIITSVQNIGTRVDIILPKGVGLQE